MPVPNHTILPVTDPGIPGELKGIAKWVTWKSIADPGAPKPRKLPWQTHGRGAASVSNASTWATYDAALAAYRNRTLGLAGVGFVLTPDDDFVGVDIDKCRDKKTGKLEPWACEILKRFQKTYCEVSPSGTGVKLLCRGTWPNAGGKCDKEMLKALGGGEVEVYSSKRYFTLTGQKLADHSGQIADCQKSLDWLAARYFASKVTRQRVPTASAGQMPPLEKKQAYQRCIAYLKKMPDAVSGDRGHDATFAACCQIFRFGLSGTDAEAAARWWNENKCNPPWTAQELAHKLTDAEGNVAAAGEIGMRTIEATGKLLPPPRNDLFPSNPSNPQDDAFYGLAGRLTAFISEFTEADPLATLVNLLTMFGSAAGRGASFQVGGDSHYPRLFVVLVGRTGKSRKGSSLGLPLKMFRFADPDWKADHVVTGLSSGEGLIAKCLQLGKGGRNEEKR